MIMASPCTLVRRTRVAFVFCVIPSEAGGPRIFFFASPGQEEAEKLCPPIVGRAALW